MFSRRKIILAAVSAAVLSAAPVVAQETFPNKPISFVVPTAAGGASDIVARTIAKEIEVTLGQPVVVENRPGANGNIGAELVLGKPADGYTLMMGHIGLMSVNVHLYSSIKFDPLKDFTPVSRVASYPSVLVVHPDVPVKTVQEFIDYAKANPGLKFGSPGFGTSQHMSMESFKLATGVNLVHVPYKGAAPALADLMGGHITVAFSDPLATLPQVRAGTVRALGVGGPDRLAVAPEIPTVADTVPGFAVEGWTGVVIKAGTPADRIAKLNEHINKALSKPEVLKSLNDKGAKITLGPPEMFGKYIESEYARWKEVVQKGNLKVQ